MIDIGAAALFLLAIGIGYFVRRRVYLGLVDPLQFIALNEAVWVITVHQLHEQGVADARQVSVFAVCLLLWWAAWWLGGDRWGGCYHHAMQAFWHRMAMLPAWIKTRVFVLYMIGLSTVVAATIAAGGGGDNRLSIMKALRPIESLTALLLPIVLFHLLVSRRRSAKWLLVAIMAILIVTGGKAATLQLLVPLTGAVLIGRMTIRPSTIAALALVGAVGFGASVVINYGAGSLSEIAIYLYTRIALDGDVYLLAWDRDLLSYVSTTSLTTYLLGPLIKVLFLPVPIDVSIGAQLFSLAIGEDSPNGPNPHWPIVLLAYHRGPLAAAALSTLCFSIVLWIKLRWIARPASRRWPLWSAIPFNAFVLLYPQLFFADPSFPTIYLVQAIVLAGVLSLALRPWHTRRSGARSVLGASPAGPGEPAQAR